MIKEMKEKYHLRKLLLPLILPLSLLAIVFFVLGKFLHCIENFQGLFYNLATTFLGILLTVAYINYVLYRKEREYWNVARKRIYNLLFIFANITITDFRLLFGYGQEIMKKREYTSDVDFLTKTRLEMIRIAKNILIPSTETKVSNLDVKGWKDLSAKLKSIWDESERILKLFGNHLEPEIFTLLLDIQDRAWSIILLYSTYPDICGFPNQLLRDRITAKTKVSDIEIKNYVNKSTTNYIKDIINYAIQILEFIDI